MLILGAKKQLYPGSKHYTEPKYYWRIEKLIWRRFKWGFYCGPFNTKDEAIACITDIKNI